MKNSILVLLIFICSSLFAQKAALEKMVEMAKNDNQTTKHLEILTGRFGGRLVGSDGYENSLDWAVSKFEEWGLEVSIEEAGQVPVGFNRGPWSGRLIGADEAMNLHFVTPSYTSGTLGPQQGRVFIEPYTTAEFNKIKGLLKGSWVLVGGMNSGWPIASGAADNEMRREAIKHNDNAIIENQKIAAANRANGTNTPLIELKKIPGLFYEQMTKAGVLGLVQSSQVPLRALYDKNIALNPEMTFDKIPTICDIKLEAAQYNKIYQMVKEYRRIELEFDIRNHFKMGPIKYHNVVAKIEGSKYPDEYVLVSGHLDAFDAGTGAVDCGVGVTATMEAARLISQSGAKPERTMLFILFAAEEFGLLGAKAWCAQHPEKLDKISNLFNRDGGSTPATGITAPKSMLKEFEKAAEYIRMLHPGIPFDVTVRNPSPKPAAPGGHDGSVYMVEGVPALGFGSADALGYNFNYGEIWHTEYDIFNRNIPEYQEHAAAATAIMSLSVANMSKLIPRNEVYK